MYSCFPGPLSSPRRSSHWSSGGGCQTEGCRILVGLVKDIRPVHLGAQVEQGPCITTAGCFEPLFLFFFFMLSTLPS